MDKKFAGKIVTGLMGSASELSGEVSRLAIDAETERSRMEVWLNERVCASAKEPITEVVTLTPVLAHLLLQKNTANRPISETNMSRIKRDILAGHWDFNGQPIVISKDGFLNDGQHRIRAVIETGRSIRMVIVFGPERKSRFTLDQGVGRTVGHYLAMQGFEDANPLASTANYAWQYRERGRLSNSGADSPTNSEARLMVEHYGDLRESLEFISRPGATVLCSKPMLAFTHWAISRSSAGERAATEFFNRLIGGAGLGEGSPILYCRNRLIQMKGTGSLNNRAELIFRAWNSYRRGEKVDRITISGRKLPELER